MIYSKEVEEMCTVAQGVQRGLVCSSAGCM